MFLCSKPLLELAPSPSDSAVKNHCERSKVKRWNEVENLDKDRCRWVVVAPRLLGNSSGFGKIISYCSLTHRHLPSCRLWSLYQNTVFTENTTMRDWQTVISKHKNRTLRQDDRRIWETRWHFAFVITSKTSLQHSFLCNTFGTSLLSIKAAPVSEYKLSFTQEMYMQRVV